MKNIKLSQDLGVMPMGGAPAPEAPPAPSFKIIYSPLDSLGKILADVDFKTFLQNNFGTNPEELAHDLWVMYGGPEDELSEGKKGKRKDSPESSDPTEQDTLQQEEYNRTRKTKWERLPEGVSIEEITDPQSLETAIRSGFAMLAKMNNKPATAYVKNWVRIANIADNNGDFKYADKIQNLINDVIHLF